MTHNRSRYMSGCRCDECRAANAAVAFNARRQRRRDMEAGRVAVEHGTVSTYVNYLCRCAECTEVHSAACKARHLSRKGATA